MISRYKLMRGLLKRKSARRLAWNVLRVLNRRKLVNFKAELLASSMESYTEYDSASIDKVVAGLELNGAVEGPKLPERYVDYLVAFAERTPCYADRVPSQGFYLRDREAAEKKLGKKLLLAQYFNVQSDKVISDLAQDPFLLSVAANYLGAPPQLMSANMWWTFPVDASDEDRAKHAHVFHYDLDDVKFVKFFFYLTNVDEDSGPHVYVKGSNRKVKYKNSMLKSKRFTDEEIIQAYGKENIIHVLGKPGTCLVEDTITLHKGVTPTERARLILQFEYSINTYPEISCVVKESEQKLFV
ncbi:phytanoyl-CoA dioxygenase family protein [Pseudomonas aeruginosa]|uniref:phytanoyl-CoA dioxygenase family protein n=1 Tax=Pseudomonas aeruginosa TaxID=287 RepID=UPI00068C33A1|nr:phytanoyl-CoA dioxygenase family protein [Pseudomonas aeruginosa]